MFGYVNVDKPNMLIKDYAEYNAYYCGLCKSMGVCNKRQTSRFFINYDVTFLSILAHNYRGVKPKIEDGRCIAHMLGKKFPIVINDKVQEIIVDVNNLLGYYKIYDNILDDGSVAYKSLMVYYKSLYKRSAKKYPQLDMVIAENYQRLRMMEKYGDATLDMMADTFATILKEVGRVACGTNDDENLDVLCYNLGRWIYIIDAYDDLKKDVKERKFNPLLGKNKTLTAELEEEIYNTVKFSLDNCIKFIRSSYDNMQITISEGAISNVVYCGLRAKTQEVLCKRGGICKTTHSRH